MPHPTALFALSIMQCQMHIRISRVKNIGNVCFRLKQRGVSPTPRYGALLVALEISLFLVCCIFYWFIFYSISKLVIRILLDLYCPVVVCLPIVVTIVLL